MRIEKRHIYWKEQRASERGGNERGCRDGRKERERDNGEKRGERRVN